MLEHKTKQYVHDPVRVMLNDEVILSTVYDIVVFYYS